MKANLFIACACKSGTSFLHDFLGKQNEVCPSMPKEPYYFELKEDKRNHKEYLVRYFKHYSGEKYILDGRHRNMFFSWIPQDIYNYNKDSKVIFILRNPIDRAYSHWWMWYARNKIKSKFHKTVKDELKRISKEGYQMDFSPEEYAKFVEDKVLEKRLAYADALTIVESGYYYTQISRFKGLFGEHQLLILDYDEISDPMLLSQKLTEFLNITICPFKKEQRINQAPEYYKYKTSFSKFIPKTIKSIIKDCFFRKREIPEKSRRLLKKHYLEEIEKLQKEFGIEFAKKWK